MLCGIVFFQAEDGIRDLVRSRGLGDVYKRQPRTSPLLRRGLGRRKTTNRLRAIETHPEPSPC